MHSNDFDSWGPCSPAEAQAIAAGMADAEREGHWVQGDGTWDWAPEPEPWEQEPAGWDDAPEAVYDGR